MDKPRRIQYEFADLIDDNKSYHYWEWYAKDLEKYIEHLESKTKGHEKTENLSTAVIN